MASIEQSDLAPLLNSIADMVIVVTGDRIAYINRAGCDFLGAAGGQGVVGERLDKFHPARLM